MDHNMALKRSSFTPCFWIWNTSRSTIKKNIVTSFKTAVGKNNDAEEQETKIIGDTAGSFWFK